MTTYVYEAPFKKHMHACWASVLLEANVKNCQIIKRHNFFFFALDCYFYVLEEYYFMLLSEYIFLLT